MKTGITEFSFGYAFTENLIRASQSGPSTAPYFPNLIQEATLGYDVQIAMPAAPIFFQYKVPEVMTRRSAKEISRYRLPIHLPFFRMPLMRRDKSRQHELLVTLENSNPGAVFYASPQMQSSIGFNRCYAACAVHTHSALFSPAEIGLLPDNRDHVVAYERGASTAWFCSEPRMIKMHSLEGAVDRVVDQMRRRVEQRLIDVVAETLAMIHELVPRALSDQEQAIRERMRLRRRSLIDIEAPSEEALFAAEEILVAREFARIGLGVDLTFAQPRPE